VCGSGDIRIGLPHVDRTWSAVVDETERGQASRFPNNGWVVAALQTACSALTHTGTLRDAIIAAVRASHDTDTVAAVTGSSR